MVSLTFRNSATTPSLLFSNAVCNTNHSIVWPYFTWLRKIKTTKNQGVNINLWGMRDSKSDEEFQNLVPRIQKVLNKLIDSFAVGNVLKKEIFTDPKLGIETQKMVDMYFAIKTVSTIEGFIYSEEEFLNRYKNTYSFMSSEMQKSMQFMK